MFYRDLNFYHLNVKNILCFTFQYWDYHFDKYKDAYVSVNSECRF